MRAKLPPNLRGAENWLQSCMKLILDRLKRSSPPAIGDQGGGGEVIMPGSAAGKATIAVGEDQAGQMDRAIAFPCWPSRRHQPSATDLSPRAVAARPYR